MTSIAAALEESIEHWRTNIALAQNGLMRYHDISADACALCEKFIRDACVDCPVFERTGRQWCHNTPHGHVSAALRDFYGSKPNSDERRAAGERLIAACIAEHDFLMSLRRA